MKTNCLIIEDEALAADIIEDHIKKAGILNIVGKCKNAIEALGYINNIRIDLIFLDIQMPKMNGIDFLKNISNPPAVIITTAYPDYAIDGYELEVVDYLLKPISFNRFVKAINKYLKQNKGFSALIHELGASCGEQDAFIFVKSQNKMVKVYLNNIKYIESYGNYILFHQEDDKAVQMISSLQNIERILPENKFIRVHRSYILPVNKIDSYTGANIKIDGKMIPIGKYYKNQVLGILGQNSIK